MKAFVWATRAILLTVLFTATLTTTSGADSTTSTTLPDAQPEDVIPSRNVQSNSAVDSPATPEFSARSRCTVGFHLEDQGDWVSIRFIAAYDEAHGRFTGPPENIDCTWNELFEAYRAENHSGVLQIQAANPQYLTLVHGPAEIGSCTYETDAQANPDTFLLQVQEALTAIPAEIQNQPPSIAITVNCSSL